ncbi:Uma2 family endonuclease [Lamprobacter modestohalophilus]|uniref:Uma2 family endonuclease n=1 Tax=Lamprobacter modestohalophilus TaxID=1064514 RepID=UPI002ADECC39|nr:Uma2 family endonuclease [Lamprobacter modestohalophilus]MEA1048951.1 Uma2 family endonuclease [Lamprobacter modestohalophilus]
MSDQALAHPQRSPTTAERLPPSDLDFSPPSEAGRRVSEEVYWRDYYDQSEICYEWNNGVLEEKPVSNQETFLIYAWLLRLLATFVASRPIAALTGLDMGFRLALPTGTVIRRPDMAVVHNANPKPLLLQDNSYHGIYDLCIEALSDLKRADIERDTRQKKREYAAGGVPEYYILHADPELRAFYRREPVSGRYHPIPEVDGIIASAVLPGFQFRVADLLRRPEDAMLLDDPVYANFVLPGWQKDRLRAETEANRADAEAKRAQAAAQRADAEAQRANVMAARLRELGIEPDDLQD